jgi:hypothetical protein
MHIISYFFFKIPYVIVLIAKIRYKMTPKDIIIGAFQPVDRIKIRLRWVKMKGRRFLGQRSEDPTPVQRH